jgi:peptidoglycan/xylan/chitin deacetylase (PgdA/CDA1 family)
MSLKQIGLRDYRSTVKRLIKVAIGLVVYIADEAAGLVKRTIGIRPPGTTVVIYYHQVSRANQGRFARQMDHLLRWATPVRAENAASSADDTSWRVAVTADDGWVSFAENALPELEKRNIPSTLFVVSHRLGDKLSGSEKIGDLNDRLISESQLMNLSRELVTIGSHTATHPRLTTAPAAAVYRELLDSRIRLRKLLGVDVNLICFPFSNYDESTLKMSRSAGYLRAFGAQTTPLSHSHDAFLIQRVRVDPTDWPIEFHLKLMNAYRMAFCAVRLKQQIRAALSRLSSAPRTERLARYRGDAATGRYSDASK